jgi:AraC-like DNA-binding protein
MSVRLTGKEVPHSILRIGSLLPILTILDELGANPEEILEAAGINSSLIDDPDILIPYEARAKVIAQSVEATGCEHLGLLIGQRMNICSLGLPGVLARSMPDAETALRTLQKHFSAHTNGAALELEIDGNIATLAYVFLSPRVEATEQLGAGAIAGLLNVMQNLCGPEFQALEASFGHQKPSNIRPFREFFKIPLYFDAPQYSLIFSRKWLHVSNPNADEDLRRILQKQVDSLETTRTADFTTHMKHLIQSALIAGDCSEANIALRVNMCPRTLIRRLKLSGTSFRELLDETRFELAKRMLRNTSMQVSEISDALCYSRASSFDRAFRRWSGYTPAEWRESRRKKSKATPMAGADPTTPHPYRHQTH